MEDKIIINKIFDASDVGKIYAYDMGHFDEDSNMWLILDVDESERLALAIRMGSIGKNIFSVENVADFSDSSLKKFLDVWNAENFGFDKKYYKLKTEKFNLDISHIKNVSSPVCHSLKNSCIETEIGIMSINMFFKYHHLLDSKIHNEMWLSNYHNTFGCISSLKHKKPLVSLSGKGCEREVFPIVIFKY